METFADRLREEIEYLGITRKELAYKADVKIRALDMYLGTQGSMPPADVAVRIAKALNTSVEYLVTGIRNNTQNTAEISPSPTELNLSKVSPNTRQFLETAISLFAEHENPKP
ncbi:helix-turn-helix domain-containing protein [Treponema bryantii]|uniref:helix-turn-helix domain-containing protein n=1 Tax=Treponema bryantii TaxID=163 RepID=UPI0003B3259C|nr:helix-turn-helix transcriptional regulator [Treponema bryantii]